MKRFLKKSRPRHPQRPWSFEQKRQERADREMRRLRKPARAVVEYAKETGRD